MKVADHAKVHGKVAGKLFTGAYWKLKDRYLEIVIANDDGTVVCEDDIGQQVTIHANDLIPGQFLGDKYAEYDKEPEEDDDIPY